MSYFHESTHSVQIQSERLGDLARSMNTIGNQQQGSIVDLTRFSFYHLLDNIIPICHQVVQS